MEFCSFQNIFVASEQDVSSLTLGKAPLDIQTLSLDASHLFLGVRKLKMMIFFSIRRCPADKFQLEPSAGWD